MPVPHQSSPQEMHLGYQSAIALWTYEGTLIWAKFNAMLVANSVVAAVVGLTIGATSQPYLPRIMSVLGLVLCVLWFALTKRGFDNYVYWILSAREIEAHLGDQVAVVSRGGAFADGEATTFVLEDGRTTTRRMSWFSRQHTAALAAYLVIVVFAVMYCAFLVVSSSATS